MEYTISKLPVPQRKCCTTGDDLVLHGCMTLCEPLPRQISYPQRSPLHILRETVICVLDTHPGIFATLIGALWYIAEFASEALVLQYFFIHVH